MMRLILSGFMGWVPAGGPWAALAHGQDLPRTGWPEPGGADLRLSVAHGASVEAECRASPASWPSRKTRAAVKRSGPSIGNRHRSGMTRFSTNGRGIKAGMGWNCFVDTVDARHAQPEDLLKPALESARDLLEWDDPYTVLGGCAPQLGWKGRALPRKRYLAPTRRDSSLGGSRSARMRSTRDHVLSLLARPASYSGMAFAAGLCSIWQSGRFKRSLPSLRKGPVGSYPQEQDDAHSSGVRVSISAQLPDPDRVAGAASKRRASLTLAASQDRGKRPVRALGASGLL